MHSIGALRQELTEAYAIIESYSRFFLVFDLILVGVVILSLVIIIKYLKSRKNQLSSDEYLRYTILGQEAERERIARELHDTVAQDVRWCKSTVEKGMDGEQQQKVASLLADILGKIRTLSYNLAPPDLTKADLVANLQSLCRAFEQSASSENAVQMRFIMPSKPDIARLSEEESLNLYRIVQESLSNVQNHAHAHEVTVLLRPEASGEEEGIYIFVTDDGDGFDLEKVPQHGHYGLSGMKRRASLIGASLTISSEPGEGTCVTVIKHFVRHAQTEGGV